MIIPYVSKFMYSKFILKKKDQPHGADLYLIATINLGFSLLLSLQAQ
jgi:hypothetical protein